MPYNENMRNAIVTAMIGEPPPVGGGRGAPYIPPEQQVPLQAPVVPLPDELINPPWRQEQLQMRSQDPTAQYMQQQQPVLFPDFGGFGRNQQLNPDTFAGRLGVGLVNDPFRRQQGDTFVDRFPTPDQRFSDPDSPPFPSDRFPAPDEQLPPFTPDQPIIGPNEPSPLDPFPLPRPDPRPDQGVDVRPYDENLPSDTVPLPPTDPRFTPDRIPTDEEFFRPPPPVQQQTLTDIIRGGRSGVVQPSGVGQPFFQPSMIDTFTLPDRIGFNNVGIGAGLTDFPQGTQSAADSGRSASLRRSPEQEAAVQATYLRLFGRGGG